MGNRCHVAHSWQGGSLASPPRHALLHSLQDKPIFSLGSRLATALLQPRCSAVSVQSDDCAPGTGWGGVAGCLGQGHPMSRMPEMALLQGHQVAGGLAPFLIALLGQGLDLLEHSSAGHGTRVERCCLDSWANREGAGVPQGCLPSPRAGSRACFPGDRAASGWL